MVLEWLFWWETHTATASPKKKDCGCGKRKPVTRESLGL